MSCASPDAPSPRNPSALIRADCGNKRSRRSMRHPEYGLRPTWKLAENSIDGYHAASARDRYFNDLTWLGTGTWPPAPNVSWLSPPTLSCAAVTPASSSRRCARPNPSPPPPPSATTSLSPRTSHPARPASGSPTWPPGTGPSPIGSPTGRARRSRPKTPTTATSARRSPPGPGRAGSRSCSRPYPRSRPPRGSSNARQTATPTGKPLIESGKHVRFLVS
jgi:hypothetical protein